MRSRAETDVILSLPVKEVVPALEARPRVVGNLVLRVASSGEEGRREIDELRKRFLSGKEEFSFAEERAELSALLYG
jgi:hypothetical protein